MAIFILRRIDNYNFVLTKKKENNGKLKEEIRGQKKGKQDVEVHKVQIVHKEQRVHQVDDEVQEMQADVVANTG